MEIDSASEGKLAVRARDYSLVVDPQGPWLHITWSGGRATLGGGAGEGDGDGRWVLAREASGEGAHASSGELAGRAILVAGDGRRLHLEFHEGFLYAQAELPHPGPNPALLSGPGQPLFRRLFSPEPTALRKHLFAPHEKAVAAIGSDPSFHGGHWFFSPPPFCFALEAAVGVETSEAPGAPLERSGDVGQGPVPCRPGAASPRRSGTSPHPTPDRSWRSPGRGPGSLIVGVACPAQELDFSSFEYDGAFRVRYDHLPQGSPYLGPRLVVLPVEGDGYRAVQRYCDHLRDNGLAPRGTGRRQPAWWSEPNFCGWGEQSYQGWEQGWNTPDLLPEGAPQRCTRRFYRETLARLEAEGVDPGVVTIDDKWQRVYGLARPDEERWPDLPGFIAAQHARGRRVLLWWKLWDGEGLPPEELLAGGPRPVVDPTSAEYRARLAGEVRHALLELGADGFKVDFLHRGPTPDHGPSRGGVSGVRLLRAMLEALREPALEAREDALLVSHSVNPYLADLVDVVRLNDLANPPGVYQGVVGEMRHRARLARAACPEAPIDTDNWPCPNRHQWREYVAAQPEIGVPSLYYATGIDLSGERFQPEDYALVRQSWRRWREGPRTEA